MVKSFSKSLKVITYLYIITSLLGIFTYPLLYYVFPFGSFGSRFYVYLFFSAESATTGIISIIWYLCLLTACVLALVSKHSGFFQFMVAVDLPATVGFLVYVVIRDGPGSISWLLEQPCVWGLLLNAAYCIWLFWSFSKKA